MTSRQVNLLLNAGAAVTVCLALVVLGTATLLPTGLAPSGTDESVSVLSAATRPAAVASGENKMLARSFRNSLEDAAGGAKAAATPTAVQPSAPVQMTLMGTIGDSLAMLRMADGTTIARGVGERVENAEIVRVQSNSVTFRRDGREFSVNKPAVDNSSGPIVIR